MGQTWQFFHLFSSFSHFINKSCLNFNNINRKSVDGVLGIRTLGRRIEGTYETTVHSSSVQLLRIFHIVRMILSSIVNIFFKQEIIGLFYLFLQQINVKIGIPVSVSESQTHDLLKMNFFRNPIVFLPVNK